MKTTVKGTSLTIKWAAVSSFFIFIVFTTFATIIYQTAVNLIVAKEHENIEQTVEQVKNRLAVSDENLSVTTVFAHLSNHNEEREEENKRVVREGHLLELDPLISELGQRALFMSVFDQQGVMLFKTKKEVKEPLMQKGYKAPEIVTLNGHTGFLMIQPIQSIQTKETIGYIQSFYELSSFYDIRNRLLAALIASEVVLLILSAFVGFVLSSYFLRPLRLLRNTMDTIRKNPQSTIQMPEINTDDELSALAEMFNEMLDRMRRYIEQQEQFVEDVSHELRTPVAILEGHLNLLNRWGKQDPEILDESLTASLQEISRMKSLIQEMLDLSRAEQVDTQYAHYTSKAKEVVYQVFNNFKMLYPEFVFTLNDALAEEVTLKIYRNHFEQLLIIILDNAVKYSTQRKEIYFSISQTKNEVEIAIQDFGEGITKENIDKIFNRFYRVDKARARNKGGNGLGLSIAKQLVENYKGRLHVESVVNQGTTFHIFIPILNKKNAIL